MVYDDMCWNYIERKYEHGDYVTFRFGPGRIVRLASRKEIGELT